MSIRNIFKKKEPKEPTYSGSCFILAAESNFNKVMDCLCNAFGISTDGEGNTINLNNNDIKIRIGVFSDTGNNEEKEFIKDQIGRIYGHFYEVNTDKTDIKTNLLYKIGSTHSFIIINYSFDNDNVDEKKAMIEYPLVSTLKEII